MIFKLRSPPGSSSEEKHLIHFHNRIHSWFSWLWNIIFLQVLWLVMLVVLQEEGASVKNNMGWKTVTATVPCKPDQESEIQHHHLPPNTPLQSVQVLPQPVLLDHGVQSVHTSAEDRIPLHLLVPTWFCVVSDHHQRSNWWYQVENIDNHRWLLSFEKSLFVHKIWKNNEKSPNKI